MESTTGTHMEHYILNSHTKKAFTLLELLIVIAIIGILVSIGVASYAQAQKKARDSRRTSDMKAVQAAFEQYYADNNGNYPLACATPNATYLPAGLPTDPKTSSPYVNTSSGCTAGTAYCFCALLESGGGNATDNTCSYGTGAYFCVSNLQ
jgi:prepilin-type N-terminal cleavage/methylation domain-containing protein